MARNARLATGVGKSMVRLLAVSLVLLAALSCVPPAQQEAPVMSLDRLLSEARTQNFTLTNPFAVDPAIAEEVDKAVGRDGLPADRLRRLSRYLNERGFHYESSMSLTADEAFQRRGGDCMAYTNLFLGLARSLGIPAHFVHISEAMRYYERNGLYFVSSHMAVGYASLPYNLVIDFAEERDDFAMTVYETIDDATAVGLFYNNLAADQIAQNNVNEAEKLLRFIIGALPSLKEAQNNLGVVLIHQRRFNEALDVLQDAVNQHPSFQPLYTNIVQAANGAGRRDLARAMERQGLRFLGRDPFFLFNEALASFQAGDMNRCEEELQRALTQQRNNPSLWAWLARAYLRAGRMNEGTRAFERAQRLAPQLPLLAVIRQEHAGAGLLPPAPDVDIPTTSPSP